MKKKFHLIKTFSAPSFFTAIIFLCLHLPGVSQVTDSAKVQKPLFFPGTGTGINNINGVIGFSCEVRTMKNTTITGAAGIGLWGNKYSLAARYYRDFPFQVYYSAGFSYVLGLDSMDFQIPNNITGLPEAVSLRLKPCSLINLALGYQFRFRSKLRIGIELGYAIRLGKDYYVPSDPETDLYDYSTEVPDALIPGGFILGAGISLAL